jgi:glutathione S-transferase
MVPGPEIDKSDWLKVKFQLGLDFPNLPYYIDGDLKITESNAIKRHLGRKNGLTGRNEEEKAHADMLENLSYNFHLEFARVCYGPNFEEISAEYKKGLPDKLKRYSDFLANKKFFTSDQITFADFHMYELIDILHLFSPESVEAFPNLMDFKKRIEELPKIKEYMESNRFIKSPIFASSAHWGNE